MLCLGERQCRALYTHAQRLLQAVAAWDMVTGLGQLEQSCGAQITLEELNVISKLPHYCPVCAYHEWNLDGLVEMIWEYLDLLRIYTKPKARTRLCMLVGRVARLSSGAVDTKSEQDASKELYFVLELA